MWHHKKVSQHILWFVYNILSISFQHFKNINLYHSHFLVFCDIFSFLFPPVTNFFQPFLVNQHRDDTNNFIWPQCSYTFIHYKLFALNLWVLFSKIPNVPFVHNFIKLSFVQNRDIPLLYGHLTLLVWRMVCIWPLAFLLRFLVFKRYLSFNFKDDTILHT